MRSLDQSTGLHGTSNHAWKRVTRQRVLASAFGTALATAFAPAPAQAVDACYVGEAVAPDFQFNGDATIDRSQIRVTPDLNDKRGTVFYVTPLSTAGNLQAFLTVDIATAAPPGADGIAFVMQNSGAGAMASEIQGGASAIRASRRAS